MICSRSSCAQESCSSGSRLRPVRQREVFSYQEQLLGSGAKRVRKTTIMELSFQNQNNHIMVVIWTLLGAMFAIFRLIGILGFVGFYTVLQKLL